MADNPGVRQAERRLVRRRENRLIAGVAGGLSDYTGLDPAIFRVTFLALVLFAGGGVILYLLGWLLIPKAGSPESYGERLVKQIARVPWVLIGMIGIGAFLLADATGIDFNAPSLAWALALIAIGLVLLRRDRPAETPSDTAITRKLRFRRERSPLGWITLGAAIIATGIAALAHNVGVTHLDVGDYAALALLIVGVGLALGAWLGRGRWLILIGLVMVPIVGVASLIDMPLRGAIGSHSVYAFTFEEIPGSYELLAGNLVVNLSQVNFKDRGAELDITVGAGNVAVYVPRSVEVTLDAHTNLGFIHALRDYQDGFDARILSVATPDDATGTLKLKIEGGFADITVYRSPDGDGRREHRPENKRDKKPQRRDRGKR